MEDKLTATAYLLAPQGERRTEIVEEVVKGMLLDLDLLERREGFDVAGARVMGAHIPVCV